MSSIAWILLLQRGRERLLAVFSCKVRTRYSPPTPRGPPLVTPAKAGVQDRVKGRGSSAASSPFLFVRHHCFLRHPRATETEPVWTGLARAKGSLGWNDGLRFGLRLTKRRSAYRPHPTSHFLPPATYHALRTTHRSLPEESGEQGVGNLRYDR